MSRLFKTKWQKAIWIIWIIVVISIVGQSPSFGDKLNNIPLNPVTVVVQAITSFVIAIVIAALFVKHKE